LKIFKFIIILCFTFTVENALSKTQNCGEFSGSLVKWNLDENTSENEISFSFPSEHQEYEIIASALVTYGDNDLKFETTLWKSIKSYHTGYVELKDKTKKIIVCASYSFGSCFKRSCSVYNGQ